MSVLRFPEGINSVWDNAAFDDGESEDNSSTILKSSWSSLKTTVLNSNPSESLESFSSKENRSPLLEKSLLVVKSPVPLKALDPNGSAGNSRIKSIMSVSKLGFEETLSRNGRKDEEARDEKKIDQEMEAIEREICRLSSRLEALRIEKFEKSAKVEDKRENDLAEKVVEQKRNVKMLKEKKMVEESLAISARKKTPGRGLSLCPGEITAIRRRGLSLGPAEIFKSVQLVKQERMTTPVQATQNRRKSCFWKLNDIDEEMVALKERRKSLSLSPKSRKSIVTTQASRQVATTIASKKAEKKDDWIPNSIQPKQLFMDGEKSVATNKKAPRPGRVVASRYNQSTAQVSVVRKRSLPENENDGSKRCDKKRSLSVGKSRVVQGESKNSAGEIRGKKKWEIPNEVAVHRSSEAEDSPLAIAVPNVLPRIRISRTTTNETPRDSGPAKRVTDLIGRKSYFSNDDGEEDEESICQALSFTEEDVEEN